MLDTFRFYRIIPFIFIILFSSAFLQKSRSNDKSKYLFKLGDEEFHVDEFKYYFLKNNDDILKDSARIKTEEYLDLYIKFRLKVKEALSLGLDKEEGFKREFNGYKSDLIKPYLTKSKVTDRLINDTYERMKEERLASHILLKVNENALPEDTLSKYDELLNIKKLIEQGHDFDSLAQALSEDPSARANKGRLGYFSAMQMVYPFEEAAFNAQVGEVVGPVRTKFGYHLISVIDKRPARGKVKAAHIMIRPKGNSKQDHDDAYKKIEAIHQSLTAGEEWNELCAIHSEDLKTKKRGGQLSWFGSGNLVKEFEEAAFALENPGDISQPVKTRFGWHIIKLLDKKGLEPFEDIKPKLESRLKRESGSRLQKHKTLYAIKKQHGFTLNTENKTKAFTVMDSSLLKGTWKTDTTTVMAQGILFELGDEQYLIKDFWNFAVSRHRKRNHSNLLGYKNELYNRFEEKSIFDFEEKNLIETNFEYRMILQEYRNGILLFDLMEKNVWQKAVKDTLGQKQYYENNKSKYLAKESAEVKIFISKNKETIDRSQEYLDRSKKEIDSIFNAKEPLNLQVISRKLTKGEDDVVDRFWKEGLHDTYENEKYYLINVEQIIPEGIKEFEKTKGAVISDYQKDLEDKWIESLKKKYPVKINKGTLKKTISEIKSGE